MKLFVLFLLLGGAVALVHQRFARNPFTPDPLLVGLQPFRAIYDNFCVNYTTQVVTFTADLPNLYNNSGLPWNQFVSVGTGNVLSSLGSSNADCSSLSSVPALPTKLPVPVDAFINGINAFDDFLFPAQTGTQDTYQPLNTDGIVQAVQMIDSTIPGVYDTMRFFFSVNFQTLGQACTSLGSSYEQVTTPTQTLQYTADVPIVAVARSSAGTVVADPRFFAATQTPNNDLVLSITGGIHYQLEAFLESTFFDTSLCPTGQTQLVLQFGMEYTSLNSSYLVQGPRGSPGVNVDANCYNLTTRGVVRLPCTDDGVCVSRVQLQTGCRTALPNGLTFASCNDTAERSEVFYESVASYCAVANPDCAINGTGFTILFYQDSVRASVAFRAASQFLEIVQFFGASTSALNHALLANYTLIPGQVIFGAVYFPYTEIQRHFDLRIVNGTVFNITAYDSDGKLLNSLTYADLVSLGVINVGVKVTRSFTGGLAACDALLGCDSFALNGDKAAAAFPGAAYLTFNITTTLPGGYNGQGTLGTLVTSTVTQALNVSFPLGLTYTTSKAHVLIAAWVLTGVAGGTVVIGLIAAIVFYSSSGARYAAVGSVAMSQL